MKQGKIIRRSLGLGACFFIAVCGCSPHLGAKIEVPEVGSYVGSKQQPTGNLDLVVTVDSFRDSRTGLSGNTGADNAGADNFTQPDGDVNRVVRDAMSRALQEKGISSVQSAAVHISGEIKKWHTAVSAKVTSALESEATLLIEVRDNQGRKLFSGTYNGSRASQFPVASREDVKDSLGLAMAQAIHQVLDDQQFIQALWMQPKTTTVY